MNQIHSLVVKLDAATIQKDMENYIGNTIYFFVFFQEKKMCEKYTIPSSNCFMNKYMIALTASQECYIGIFTPSPFPAKQKQNKNEVEQIPLIFCLLALKTHNFGIIFEILQQY